MQAMTIIIISLITTFCVPILLLLISAYTLYNTLSMAKYAKRRNKTILDIINMGRELRKNKINVKKEVEHKIRKTNSK